MNNNTLATFKILILSLIIAGGIQIALAQWVSAPANPPSNNVPAPINVSTPLQTRAGPLQVTKSITAGGFRAYTSGIFDESVGIGNGAQVPTTKLQVIDSTNRNNSKISVNNNVASGFDHIIGFHTDSLGGQPGGQDDLVGTNQIGAGMVIRRDQTSHFGGIWFHDVNDHAYRAAITMPGVGVGIPSVERGDIGIFTNRGAKYTAFKQNGRVGIGTFNPRAKLHVAGSIMIGNAESNVCDNDNQGLIAYNPSTGASGEHGFWGCMGTSGWVKLSP